MIAFLYSLKSFSIQGRSLHISAIRKSNSEPFCWIALRTWLRIARIFGVASTRIFAALLLWFPMVSVGQNVLSGMAESTRFKTVVLVSRPPLGPIQAAFAASALEHAEPRLFIDFDVNGVPANISLNRTSGDEILDHAIVDWARQLKVTPGRAFSGALPFVLSTEPESKEVSYGVVSEVDPSSLMPLVTVHALTLEALAYRPPLSSLVGEFARSKLSDALIDVELDQDADGAVVGVRLNRLTPSESLDATVVDWCRYVRIWPGKAGMSRLSFRLIAEPGEDSTGVIRVWMPVPVEQDQIVSQIDLESMWSVLEQLLDYEIPRQGFRIRAVHDGSGQVTQATMVRGARDAALDRIVLEQFKTLRLNTKGSEAGSLEIEIFQNNASRIVQAGSKEP